ncbi:hypothetical protein NPQ18_04475 [Galbibacter orientalis]
MEIIKNNPYRIAGILSSTTERELQRQKGRITAHARVGQETESDLDFQFLPVISRKEIDVVNKAFSNIEQNQDKVNYTLFWFLNASPFDNTAIEYLKNGDEDKALEIWEKVTTDKDVNSKNFSAFNNLGTYKLLSIDKSDIKTGIEAKIKLIESEYFESFVHSVADETFTIDNQKQTEKLIDELPIVGVILRPAVEIILIICPESCCLKMEIAAAIPYKVPFKLVAIISSHPSTSSSSNRLN